MAQAGLIARAAFVAVLAGAAASCAAGAETASAGSGRLPPFRAEPGSLLLPAAPPPQAPDTCGASRLAWLVGRLRTEIPVAVDLNRRRVSCTACPVAPEVRLDRVDILYDARTGRVARVTCG